MRAPGPTLGIPGTAEARVVGVWRPHSPQEVTGEQLAVGRDLGTQVARGGSGVSTLGSPRPVDPCRGCSSPRAGAEEPLLGPFGAGSSSPRDTPTHPCSGVGTGPWPAVRGHGMGRPWVWARLCLLQPGACPSLPYQKANVYCPGQSRGQGILRVGGP